MSENLYVEYVVAMTTKTWYLLPKFDEMILWIAQSGIQRYWELQVISKYSNMKVHLGVVNEQQQKLFALRISNLSGVFSIWLIGVTVATLIFIGEIQWNKYLLPEIHQRVIVNAIVMRRRWRWRRRTKNMMMMRNNNTNFTFNRKNVIKIQMNKKRKRRIFVTKILRDGL